MVTVALLVLLAAGKSENDFSMEASLRMTRGEYEEAATVLADCVKRHPKSLVCLKLRGDVAYERGKKNPAEFELARSSWLEFLHVAPWRHVAHDEVASRVAALDVDPSVSEGQLQKANELRQAKDFEGAVKVLTECVARAPAFHPCWRTLGSVYAAMSNSKGDVKLREKSQAAYKKFLEVAPTKDKYFEQVRTMFDLE